MVDETPDRNAHYFATSPTTESDETVYEFTVDGRVIRITSDRGVFSSRGLDKGTAVLIRHLSIPESQLPLGDIVDLGCGAGPLALALAALYPNRTVWGIDVNERALDLTRRNARDNGLTNVEAVSPDRFACKSVAAIWSNPPIRIGKENLHLVLAEWLDRMDVRGICRLVVSKNLGGDTLQRWLIERGNSCERLASKSGFRVLEVTRS